MKSYKTEIKLNNEQQEQFLKTIGTCRYVYNLFIEVNKERYEYAQSFMSAISFSKWLNNQYIPNNPDKQWIKEVSSKSVKQSIMNAETAYKKFFKEKKGFPRFKSRKNNVNMYFVKTGNTRFIICKRHKIKIPTLGWIQLKEFGYLPIHEDITSGTISMKAGRFYISVKTHEEPIIQSNNSNEGIGIDLGIKYLAVLSDGTVFKNINKTPIVRKLNKKLKKEQRRLSRKYEHKKKRENSGKNLNKQLLKVQKVYQTLTNIKEDYQYKVVNEIVRTKPSYVTIENLNIKGMMKNKHLSKAISQQGLFGFIQKLKYKCFINSIEGRQVDRFYPSSKKCSCCGKIKKDLNLSDRVYKCDCGLIIDRDWNAAINLQQATDYKIVY